jgi:hypothetical protein
MPSINNHEHQHLIQRRQNCSMPVDRSSRAARTRPTSNLDFNNATKQWEVKDRKGKVRFISKSRSDCLEWDNKICSPNSRWFSKGIEQNWRVGEHPSCIPRGWDDALDARRTRACLRLRDRVKHQFFEFFYLPAMKNVTLKSKSSKLATGDEKRFRRIQQATERLKSPQKSRPTVTIAPSAGSGPDVRLRPN